MSTVTVHDEQTVIPATQAEVLAVEAVEAEAVIAAAETVVEVAAIEAERDVTIAEIKAETEVAAVEAVAEVAAEQSELEQCRQNIATLQAETAELRAQIAALSILPTSTTLEPSLPPSPLESEDVEGHREPETLVPPPVEKPRARPKTRWT